LQIFDLVYRWADQCIFGHDTNRKIPQYPTDSVGQNAATRGTTVFADSKELIEMVDAWYDEVKKNFNTHLTFG
jgi:hypothetical protein